MNPYTVLLMLPSDWRSDQPCAADEVIRIYVEAENPVTAIGAAYIALPSAMPDEEVVAEDFSPIAVYAGHHFDLHQS